MSHTQYKGTRIVLTDRVDTVMVCTFLLLAHFREIAG